MLERFNYRYDFHFYYHSPATFFKCLRYTKDTLECSDCKKGSSTNPVFPLEGHDKCRTSLYRESADNGRGGLKT